MRAQRIALVGSLLVLGVLAMLGCGSAESTESAQSGFAPGAFPPTLSGEEYHTRAWTRDDCLSCHAQGIQDAPKMRHVSVPAIAADAKCRTCHIQLLDQTAPE